MLMKLIKRGLAALGIASLAIAPTTAAEARTNRGPALSRSPNKDTTIYLFGTIHLLRGNPAGGTRSWMKPSRTRKL